MSTCEQRVKELVVPLAGVIVLATLGCNSPAPRVAEGVHKATNSDQEAMIQEVLQFDSSPEAMLQEMVQLVSSGNILYGSGSADIPSFMWPTAAEPDLLEAVFRYELDIYAANYDRFGFFLLGLIGPDGFVELSSAMLSRFTDYPGITSRPNSKPGVTITIEDLRVMNDSTILVVTRARGGCFWVKRYRFERRDGQWIMGENLWTLEGRPCFSSQPS